MTILSEYEELCEGDFIRAVDNVLYTQYRLPVLPTSQYYNMCFLPRPLPSFQNLKSQVLPMFAPCQQDGLKGPQVAEEGNAASRGELLDMIDVYGFCDGNANNSVDEYRRRFLDRRTPPRGVFVLTLVTEGYWCSPLYCEELFVLEYTCFGMDAADFFGQFATTELAIAYLQNRRIIAQNAPNCNAIGSNRPMTLIKQSSTFDGVIWRCPAHKGCKKSIRDGSFLSGQHISFKIFLMLAYYWAYSVSVGIAAVEAKVSKRRLGFLEFVPDRTRNTLLPIIERSVLPGTEIHSDEWAAYRAIPAIPVIPPYRHLTMNHSENFVSPLTGVHNNVECFWKNVKQKLKKMSGTCDAHVPSYMDEFMWRQLNGKKTRTAFDNLLDQIAAFYPV
ncbi:hypothetical protein ANN_26752 [Periplaneta americana]|uniref:ISXO2-like transposase domain-containing protein n=1 Tax=Periplaneta americana TaxID=6978 RepID=A0ABQ8RZ24_PERAM|nr:hypothetical protein ANN_26752 [Periplaneta americana]